MEEIQINDYVRTKNGLIGRVNKIEISGSGCRFAGEFFTDTIIQFNDGKIYERRVKSKQVLKHSKNIIDLIEVGDLILCSINTMRTELMQVKEYTDARKNEKYLGVDGFNIVNCKIYKIWTKEQLKTIEYNV